MRVCNGFLCSMPVTYDGAVLIYAVLVYFVSFVSYAFICIKIKTSIARPL